MLPDGKYESADRIARWFINHAEREAGEAITQLKLQKLVFYADAWFLANFDRPLIADNFEAWAHGPAHRGLYAKYRDSGWNALAPEVGELPSKKIWGFLTAVYKEYGQYGGKKLEEITHNELPWKEARGDIPAAAASNRAISKLTMRNYYAERLGKKKIKKLSN